MVQKHGKKYAYTHKKITYLPPKLHSIFLICSILKKNFRAKDVTQW
jgi:hypothetical protein